MTGPASDAGDPEPTASADNPVWPPLPLRRAAPPAPRTPDAEPTEVLPTDVAASTVVPYQDQGRYDDRPLSEIGLPWSWPGWRGRPRWRGRREPEPAALPRAGTPSRHHRRIGPALAALVLLSLCAAFFGWVSAKPLWLAVGHGETGTATVAHCTGSGIGQRCVGEFTTREGGFTGRVVLLGLADGERHRGAVVAAQVVDRDSRQAYVVSDALSLHLRWMAGLVMMLLCGAAIAWVTGAARLADPRARHRAMLLSVAAPALLTLAFLATSW